MWLRRAATPGARNLYRTDMRLVLLGGLLWFNGCVRSGDAPPQVSPTIRPAGAPGPAPTTASVAGEASEQKAQRDLGQLLNDPAIPLEDRKKLLEELLRPPSQTRSEAVDAAPTSSAPQPACDGMKPRPVSLPPAIAHVYT